MCITAISIGIVISNKGLFTKYKTETKSESAFLPKWPRCDPHPCWVAAAFWVSAEPTSPSHDLLVAIVDTDYSCFWWSILFRKKLTKQWFLGWSFLPEETSFALCHRNCNGVSLIFFFHLFLIHKRNYPEKGLSQYDS